MMHPSLNAINKPNQHAPTLETPLSLSSPRRSKSPPQFLLRIVPQLADEAVGECVEIDVEFALCVTDISKCRSRSCAFRRRGCVAGGQMGKWGEGGRHLRSTSFLVIVSAVFLSWINCTTVRRSSSPRRWRLSASLSMSICEMLLFSLFCLGMGMWKGWEGKGGTYAFIWSFLLLRALVFASDSVRLAGNGAGVFELAEQAGPGVLECLCKSVS